MDANENCRPIRALLFGRWLPILGFATRNVDHELGELGGIAGRLGRFTAAIAMASE